MTRAKKKVRLYNAVVLELANYDNVHQMEVSEGWPLGVAYRVLNGGYSPKLYKAIFPPRKRDRMIFNSPPEIITRFDNQRGKTPRAKHLVDLMDLKDGIGEVL